MRYLSREIAKTEAIGAEFADNLQELVQLKEIIGVIDQAPEKRREIIEVIAKEKSKLAKHKRDIEAIDTRGLSLICKCEAILEDENGLLPQNQKESLGNIGEIKELGLSSDNALKFNRFKLLDHPEFSVESLITKANAIAASCEELDEEFFESTIIEEKEDKKLLLSWISEVYNNSEISLDLLLRGTRDGFTTKALRENCYRKGPTVVIIKSNYSAIFGRYTSIPWCNASKPRNDPSAFIYSFTCRTKCPKRRDTYSAVWCGGVHGATFGYKDICIFDHCDKVRNRAEVSGDYELPLGIDPDTFIPGRRNFKVEEIEIFSVAIV